MLTIPIAVFSVLFLMLVADLQPKPKKSPEKELGEALEKYLTASKASGEKAK